MEKGGSLCSKAVGEDWDKCVHCAVIILPIQLCDDRRAIQTRRLDRHIAFQTPVAAVRETQGLVARRTYCRLNTSLTATRRDHTPFTDAAPAFSLGRCAWLALLAWRAPFPAAHAFHRKGRNVAFLVLGASRLAGRTVFALSLALTGAHTRRQTHIAGCITIRFVNHLTGFAWHLA